MSTQHKVHILIVDDQRETARSIRKSLENLNRRYVIADVPSGEEAMLELQRVTFDLVITEYRLPGISGPELIERALDRAPGLAIILTTSRSIDEVVNALGKMEVTGILEKPIDEAALIEAVTNVLGGDQFASNASASASSDMPSPAAVDSRTVVRELSGLRADLAANAIALVGHDGIVIGQDGEFDDSLRFVELARILAQTFRTSAEIGSYLGNGSTGAMNYYPGRWYDLYTLAVAGGAFLVVVFPGESQKQMGAVLRFGRATVEVLARMVGPAETRTTEEFVILKKTGPLKKKTGQLSSESSNGDGHWEEEEDVPIAFADLVSEETQTLDLDFDDLDAELEGLEDAGEFWEEAESDVSTAGMDSISIDEAIELGLVPKDLDD